MQVPVRSKDILVVKDLRKEVHFYVDNNTDRTRNKMTLDAKKSIWSCAGEERR